ncbi:hypothetical protein AJ85_21640 [Alkalihalobacillus alcalophilus ATCC 27647 = CGMCC 1.3604]|uniref:Uncharacterized protein n=1 Tax=Alkalihalobacillus alcalophilus ATCC 27647 = CGMCC 1.3604 TaxID=1218173 RepID=A0A094XCU4_ALKAL|nr:hypothetical protein [Alkalihalobacillus alcalophilus]KGA96625.1 hypothetical protein BALCAV_0214985 [Alkalihalobacillus alcalophilus ATCC 27647 = CGMCC 1.3604]MED1563612.1 hypothetical protein [Alkalihalobacillus alcalophilus]THG91992.1 hypothetical protein AJ85_21640 [Alkalihalobacillus alcalophilus ATCC 27647 = CGMCC 1.3604]
MYLNPSFFIIDNNSKFILSSDNKNIEIKLNDEQKDVFYNLINKIRNREGNYNHIERKFIGILKNYNMVYTNEVKEEKYEYQVYSNNIFFDHWFNQGKLESQEHSTHGLYVILTENYMVVSLGDIREKIRDYMEIDLSNNKIFLEYAKVVLKYKIFDNEFLKELNKGESLIIDLNNYTNAHSSIVLDEINYSNLSSSIYNYTEISKYKIETSQSDFFPLYTCKLRFQGEQIRLKSVGINEADAKNNLIFMIIQELSLEFIFRFSKLIIDENENYIKRVLALNFPEVKNSLNPLKKENLLSRCINNEENFSDSLTYTIYINYISNLLKNSKGRKYVIK